LKNEAPISNDELVTTLTHKLSSSLGADVSETEELMKMDLNAALAEKILIDIEAGIVGFKREEDGNVIRQLFISDNVILRNARLGNMRYEFCFDRRNKLLFGRCRLNKLGFAESIVKDCVSRLIRLNDEISVLVNSGKGFDVAPINKTFELLSSNFRSALFISHEVSATEWNKCVSDYSKLTKGAAKLDQQITQIDYAERATRIQAQTVSAVTAAQQGNELVISYALSSEVPCDVSLFVSLNEGKTWTGPLVHVSGDVGKNVSAGNRSIRWQVLEEQEQLVGSGIHFKVVANGKKSFEPEMVFVKGGTFQMGSTSGESDESPVHRVTLSDFSIGKFEVTQAQWKAVMGNNPSAFAGCSECPVEQVSWNDVQDFITHINQQTGKRYRLPSEAEWEYAARGGSLSSGYTYSGSNDIGSVAWYTMNSGSKTHEVGTRQPNELGIYDMSGNVWEWCSDWYGPYDSYSVTNPKGAASGQYRVGRGGSWNFGAFYCRASRRNLDSPDFRIGNLGFRLVLASVQ
jgi:formylglycine-generating enzyme required for sulfatase activity